MAEYRVFKLNEQNQITKPPTIIDCEGDEEATELVRAMYDGDVVVEIWKGARFVAMIRAAA